MAVTTLAVAGCSSGNETKASSPGLETVPTQVITTPSTTTTTPPRTAGGEPRSIVIIGDSISVGSEDEYHDALPLDDVEVVATSGIRLRGRARGDRGRDRPAPRRARSSNSDQRRAVDGGHADRRDRRGARRDRRPALRALGDRLRPDLEEEVATVNDHLRLEVATHPNLDLVDWSAMVDEDPDLLSADGLHPDDGASGPSPGRRRLHVKLRLSGAQSTVPGVARWRHERATISAHR